MNIQLEDSVNHNPELDDDDELLILAWGGGFDSNTDCLVKAVSK